MGTASSAGGGSYSFLYLGNAPCELYRMPGPGQHGIFAEDRLRPGRRTCTYILPRISCVTLGESWRLAELHCPYQMGTRISIS